MGLQMSNDLQIVEENPNRIHVDKLKHELNRLYCNTIEIR